MWLCHGALCEKRGESPDYKYRCGLNMRTSVGHCFNCGWKSRHAVETIAKELALGHVIVDADELPDEEPKKKVKVDLPEDFEMLKGKSKDHWFKKAKRYLTDRGITNEQIEEHAIGFSLVGRYSHRIIFPVFENRDLVGIVSRSFVGAEPRYLNTVGMKSLYKAAYTGKNPIVVASEGVFKCLKIERVIKNAQSVALLGHGLTDRQENLLGEPKELVVWPDPDIVGIKEGLIPLARRLQERMKVTVPYPMPRDQADEMGDEEVKELYLNRKPFNEGIGQMYLHQVIMKKRLG